MGLFSKGKARVEPYNLWDADAEQLARLVEDGLDPTAPCWSKFFLYFTSERRFKAASEELRLARVRHELVPPSHDIRDWAVFVLGNGVPLVPDYLRNTVDLCERIAATHEGEYDGWVAHPREETDELFL